VAFEPAYRSLLRDILNKGIRKQDRTGVGTISRSGQRLRHNLQYGFFPLLTGRSIHFKSVVAELLWMISGSTNIKDLDATIWDEWAAEDGGLGPVYGYQWRVAFGVDQLQNAIDKLKLDPHSRRIIVNSWNVDDLDQMALAPCHFAYQFVTEGSLLNCIVSQRSADMFLGVPFNMASYSLLTMLVAQQSGFRPGTVTLNFGDAHIYSNHFNQVNEYLDRTPDPCMPRVEIVWKDNINEYTADDIILRDYHPQPTIPAPVAV